MHTQNSDDWKKSKITEEEFLDLLYQPIDAININRVKADIQRFISENSNCGHLSIFKDWAKHLPVKP